MTALWVSVAGAGSYLILVGSFDTDEIVAALLLGALGAAWHAAILRVGANRFAFDRPALGVIARALAGLPGASLRVGVRLAAALRHGAAGRQVEHPFEPGRQGVPRDAGRRAVVVLASSLAPDSYVLRVPLDEESIRLHALTDRAPGGDRLWPA